MTYLQILFRNWPVKYPNHLKRLRHVSINFNKLNFIMGFIDLRVERGIFIAKVEKNSGLDDVSFNIIKKMLWDTLRTLNLPILVISRKWVISR